MILFQIQISNFQFQLCRLQANNDLVFLDFQFLFGGFRLRLGLVDLSVPFFDPLGDLRRVEFDENLVFRNQLSFGGQEDNFVFVTIGFADAIGGSLALDLALFYDLVK